MSARRSETNEFHKRLLQLGINCSKFARNEEASRGASDSGLASPPSGFQANLEIALSGASAKVKPPNRVFSPAESALRRRVT
jgi:hypothetical protein